ncbi:MAG: 30S ribosomal protein S9 [Planctomycetota bacterium]|jgi:small subunit ribosomal protein S9
MAETKVDNPDVEVADEAPESQPKAKAEPKPTPNPASEPKGGYWWGTGRRKSAVARVRIRPGSGKLMVNKKQLDDYFKRAQDRKAVLAPLKTVEAEKTFDVFINVKGGGTTGQAGASLLGIARALKKFDDNYLQALRDGGHLTRDPRMVERKKPGQRGARRRFQFSKR